jgi:hypothetical protein
MLILYIAIIVTFGFVLFAVYRNFDPEDKPMAGSLTSGFLAVIVAVIAWYAPSLLTTVRHAAAPPPHRSSFLNVLRAIGDHLGDETSKVPILA